MIEQFYIDKPEYIGTKTHPVTKTQCQAYKTKEGEELYFSMATVHFETNPHRPLPNIGDRIYNNCNGLGWAIVKGYSRAGEWLGLMTEFVSPPAFYLKNVKEAQKRPNAPEWSKQGIGITFGLDIDFVR